MLVAETPDHGYDLVASEPVLDLFASRHQESAVERRRLPAPSAAVAMSKRHWLRRHASVRYQTDANTCAVERSGIDWKTEVEPC